MARYAREGREFNRQAHYLAKNAYSLSVAQLVRFLVVKSIHLSLGP